MKQQATRYTPAQIKYLNHWQARGYSFPCGAVIPENINTPPQSWSLPTRAVLIVSAVMLAIVYGILKVFA